MESLTVELINTKDDFVIVGAFKIIERFAKLKHHVLKYAYYRT